MTEVLPPPSPTPPPSDRPPRPRPTPRPSTTASSTPSRPSSTSFPAFHSTLPYALVRDFAYPPFHPSHYGPPSNPSTPLPETWPPESPSSSDPHRKSRSLADFERGRRRESARDDGGMFFFGASSASIDPAGSSSLRHSRGQQQPTPPPPGSARRDSHFAGTLPSRRFHTTSTSVEDAIPLDAEPSTHTHSPQRASMGPEDEELFAGESLALYNFEPENRNELRLREGQVILVSYRHGQGWLVAEDPGTGEQGLVPEEYVRLVREIEGWDSERGVLGDEEGDEGVGEDEGAGEEDDGGARDGEGGEEDVLLEIQREVDGDVDVLPAASPPEIDHAQGLAMKDGSAAWKGGGEEVRQDSAHAER